MVQRVERGVWAFAFILKFCPGEIMVCIVSFRLIDSKLVDEALGAK